MTFQLERSLSQERIRSFISVDLDEPLIRERITTAQKGLQQTGAQLKLVDPEIMHLTVRFLGEIPQTTVEAVKDAMNSVRFPSFEVQFSSLGAFPNLKRINVVWVGIKHGQEQLDEIFHQLEPKLRRSGLPPDNKGFSPHLTIARVRSSHNREPLAGYISSMADQEFGNMLAKAIRLKKSTLTPKGPIYSTIHEVTASS